MSAAERVGKFHEDIDKLKSISISSSNGKMIPKLISESNKLQKWLQKHQNETIPDNMKTKLYMTIDQIHSYYKRNILDTNDGFENSVSSLLGTYLQLPEGKLLGAKDKKKVLLWLQNLSLPSSGEMNDLIILNTIWIVHSINNDNTLTIENKYDSELWNEAFAVNEQSQFDMISEAINNEMTVQIEIDNNSSKIINVNIENI
eukprot:gene14277-19154_t